MNPALEAFLKVPWSLGIYLIQWTTKDTKKVLYVEVMAEGQNLESARQSAFRMAVERAVGVIVASETEVRDQHLKRDDITTYASGFVHDYKLVDQAQRGSRTWVKMQVWVSHSHLRDRLLSQSRGEGQIEGGRISEQIQSFQHSRTSGDRLLSTVLSDYPHRAFNITVDATRVVVDSQRNMYLQVPLVIGWSDHYIKSLQTAISAINQRTDCGGWLSVCRNVESQITVGGVTGYFDDDVALTLMHRHMLTSRPVLELSLLDTSGRTVSRTCWDLPELTQNQYHPRPFVDLGGGRVMINGRSATKTDIFLPLDSISVDSLDRAEIRAIRAEKCSGLRQ
jgi:hypothetical protein